MITNQSPKKKTYVNYNGKEYSIISKGLLRVRDPKRKDRFKMKKRWNNPYKVKDATKFIPALWLKRIMFVFDDKETQPIVKEVVWMLMDVINGRRNTDILLAGSRRNRAVTTQKVEESKWEKTLNKLGLNDISDSP